MHFNVNDRVITTRSNIGVVTKVEELVEIFDEEYQDFDAKSDSPVNEETREWSFINSQGESKNLKEGVHFVFKYRYEVQFQKSKKFFNRESLRKMDKPFIVITVEDDNGVEHSFIVDDYHKPDVTGIYKSCKVVN